MVVVRQRCQPILELVGGRDPHHALDGQTHALGLVIIVGQSRGHAAEKVSIGNGDGELYALKTRRGLPASVLLKSLGHPIHLRIILHKVDNAGECYLKMYGLEQFFVDSQDQKLS